MTQETRPRYLEPDCPLTLAEGLAEFAASNPGLIPATDPRLRELVRAHDSCHVLFGLTTSIEDETLTDAWTIFGSDVELRQYMEYLKHPEFFAPLKDIGWGKATRQALRAVPRALRAIGIAASAVMRRPRSPFEPTAMFLRAWVRAWPVNTAWSRIRLSCRTVLSREWASSRAGL